MALIPENDVTGDFQVLYDSILISIIKIFINRCPIGNRKLVDIWTKVD